MKQLIAYSILFCLVFLNVPRELVHDCDNHDDTHFTEKSKNASSLSFEEDGCFVCEFDLGFFVIPDVQFFDSKTPVHTAYVVPVFTELCTGEFNSFSHRGPPIA